MFDRFDESARRALFFARYAVTELGGMTIEPEHLVLGILRESPQAILRFAAHGATADAIREPLERACGGEKMSTSVEIPFANETKETIEQTAIEADAAGNATIRCEHMLLGVMVRTSGAATRALTDAGVGIDAIREYLKGQPPEPKPGPFIARHWKGVTTAANAEAYLAHLRDDTFPGLSRILGFEYSIIQRRDVSDGVEFLIVTVWRSLDAIRLFSGEDLEAAVVPQAARALLSRYDDRVTHYEIII